jgi:hypothetical protein
MIQLKSTTIYYYYEQWEIKPFTNY